MEKHRNRHADGKQRFSGFVTKQNHAQCAAQTAAQNANRYQQIAKPKSYLSSDTLNTTYLELHKGDMVQHTAFGRGMVLSVMKMGGDALLEIAFDEIGTKKLMAKTASAHMKKL